MPTKVGIHDFLCGQHGKSWMPTFVGMTGGRGRGELPQLEPQVPQRVAHAVAATQRRGVLHPGDALRRPVG
jgi:hypothetical protein